LFSLRGKKCFVWKLISLFVVVFADF
jgi:hypothetical protein